jgi:hypothetical protein
LRYIAPYISKNKVGIGACLTALNEAALQVKKALWHQQKNCPTHVYKGSQLDGSTHGSV